MNIRNKAEMYALLESGRFGNRVRMWNSLEELLASGFGGSVSMRYKGSSTGKSYNGSIGGGFVAYGIRIEDVPRITEEWTAMGADRKKIVINENPNDDRILIQGEVGIPKLDYEMHLFYSLEKMKMRPALESGGKRAKGLRARLILQSMLWPESFADLMDLLESLPEDHTIEFGAYDYSLGNIPRRNTVIWEVRSY